MKRLVVAVRFIVRGVWVKPDVCGREFTWFDGQHQIRLKLPSTTGDFHYEHETEVVRYPAMSSTAVIESSGDAVSIDVVRIEVDIDADASCVERTRVRASGDSPEISAFFDKVEIAWHEGHEAAERNLNRWLTHVRATGTQPWLGLSAEEPVQHGRSYIYELSVDEGTLMSFGPTQSTVTRSGLAALSNQALDTISTSLAEGHDPGVAQMLLADALFLAHEAETIDSQRAILSAATACEIRVKESLRADAQVDKAVLLDMVLGGQSNVDYLLNKPYAAIYGKALPQENSDLFKKMKRLAKLRNEIIHKGMMVERHEGWALAVAVRELFELLAAKSQSRPPS